MSSDELRVLAEEQAALRRVATLVARGSAPGEVFAAIVEEVGRLLPVEYAGMGRYEPDGTMTVVADSGRPAEGFPIGRRSSLGGRNVATLVFETGRPVRIDGYDDASGSIGVAAREERTRSAVATPIVVDGRLWGVMAAGTSEGQPLPPDAEARITDFTELLAAAIANAESQAGLARLAEEQAALRRVATLVAHGVPPQGVFAAVTEEIGRVLPVDLASMCRYEPDGALTWVASWGGATEHFPVGSRRMLGGRNLGTIVFETGRSARIDNYAERSSGPIGVRARAAGINSSLATPIMVEGRLWGVIAAGSILEQPLPADTEARLASFTELVATAIANAEARHEVAASRARIAAAADDERRRVVRDLHDGAQQRLVVTIMTLKLARSAARNEEEDLPDLLTEAIDQAEQAMDELRELAHGILPAVLTQGGLGRGVDALASRMPVPVENAVSVGRLPAGVEATAYFLVAEALTNVAKHARARRATVTACVEDGALRVQVRDDGIGGARPEGSGLLGLADRLAVLDGRLRIESPTDGGTLVAADIPLPD